MHALRLGKHDLVVSIGHVVRELDRAGRAAPVPKHGVAAGNRCPGLGSPFGCRVPIGAVQGVLGRVPFPHVVRRPRGQGHRRHRGELLHVEDHSGACAALVPIGR